MEINNDFKNRNDGLNEMIERYVSRLMAECKYQCWPQPALRRFLKMHVSHQLVYVHQ